MPRVGPTHSISPPQPCSPSADAPSAPASHRAASQQQPARDVAAIEGELISLEAELAALYAYARQEGSPAPAAAQMRESTLQRTERRGDTFLTVVYRTADAPKKQHACRLDPLHEAVPRIYELEARQRNLKAELNAAGRPPLLQGRRPPGWMPRLALASPPVEMQLQILGDLDVKSLGEARRVSRYREGMDMILMPTAWRFTSAAHFRKIIAAFSKRGDLDKIHTLTLEGTSFTDDDLAVLSTLPDLTELTLFCPAVTDRCGAYIAGCGQLRRLVAPQSNLGDDFVAAMVPAQGPDNPILEELNLSGSQVTDGCAAHTLRLAALRKLDVSECELSPAFLNGLLSPRDDGVPCNDSLEVLKLANNPGLGDAAGTPLSRFRALRELDVGACGLGDPFLEEFLSASENFTLGKLAIGSNPRMTDNCASYISRCRTLKALDVGASAFTDQFIADLLLAVDGNEARLITTLKSLNIAGCDQMTDESGRAISRLQALEQLNAGHCDLGGGFVRNLLGQSNGENIVLKRLDLRYTDLTDGAAEHLRRFRQLETLILRGCIHIAATFLKNLLPHAEAKNKVLKALDMGGCVNLEDGCGESISRFEALEILVADGCALLTDAFARQLPASVKHFHATGTDVSRAMKATLAQRMKFRWVDIGFG